MSVQEITDEAIRQGYLSPFGKTPAATMSACLYVTTRDDPDCAIKRVFESGAARAVRGSVRWTVREAATEAVVPDSRRGA